MTRKSLYIIACLMAMLVQAFGVSAAIPDRAARAAYRATHPHKSTAMRSPAARVHAGENQLYAVHCEAEYGALEGWGGVVKVLSGAADPEPVHQFKYVPFQGAFMDGKVLVVFHNAVYDQNGESEQYVIYEVYDTDTWEREQSTHYTVDDAYRLPYGLAYDHTTDRVYGSFYAETLRFNATEDATFGYIDLSDTANPVKIIAELPERMRAMTFDKDGNLFGLSYGGDIYSIDKQTGNAKQTGVNVLLPTVDYDGDGIGDADPSAPVSSYGRESMCCDWATGDFYIAYSDSQWDSFVSRFSPGTGEAEIVANYSFGEEGTMNCNILTALSFRQNFNNGKTIPVAPTELTVTPVGIELKADVAFTMPTVDTNKEPLDADMNWTLTDGTSELASGVAHSGEKVTAVVNAPAGNVTFTVTVTLEGETSKPATATVFIGCDTPLIKGLPAVRVNGTRLTVSWNAAVAANSGNLDVVTYKVTRMPDNVVVAEACEATKLTDVIESEIKTLYYYLIQPFAGTVAGESVESRSVYAGKYFSLPLNEYFDDEKRFLEYPVIDGNNDGNVWEYSSNYDGVAMYPGTSTPANDYLLIGPFVMEKGITYTFHMSAEGQSAQEQISVYVGTDADDASSFTNELVAPTVLDQGRKSFDGTFCPAVSGDYYFGIKACTPGTSRGIYLHEVEISTDETGIVNPGTTLGESTLAVTSGNGVICISGGVGEEVAVYTVTGIRVATTRVEGTVEIPVAAGVYVLRAGNIAAKVAVR